MFKQNSKYRLHFLITFVVLLIFQSAYNFFEFNQKNDGMNMMAGSVFGVLALFYMHDLYEFFKNKKRINS